MHKIQEKYNNIPTVSTCCCCIDLKIGGLIVGILKMILYLYAIFTLETDGYKYLWYGFRK